MEQQVFLELIKYGGGTAIIIALVFLFREISGLISLNKRNGAIDKLARKTDYLETKIDNEYFHLLDKLSCDVRELREDIQDLQQRVSRLETKVFNNK